MQVLLINQNATIDRLVKLSSGKLGYELVCAKDISEVKAGEYGFVIMDSDLYNRDEFELLKQKFRLSKYILIISKGVEKPEGFDIYVEKPFLPTEMVDILSANAPTESAPQEATPKEESFDDTFNQTPDGGGLTTGNDHGKLAEPEPIGGGLSLEGEEPRPEDQMDMSSDTPQGDALRGIKEEPAVPDESEDMQTNLDEHLEGLEDRDSASSSIGEMSSNDEVPEPLLDEGSESGLREDLEKSGDESSDFGDMTTDDDSDKTKEELSLGMDELTLEEETSEIKENLELGSKFELDGTDSFEEKTENKTEDEMVSSHIFDEDEVNRLKNLLDETEGEPGEADESNMENIKIHNDELGSLTEESLAEALGVSIDSTPKEEELESTDLDAPTTPSLPTAPIEEQKRENLSSNAIQLNPNQSITLSLDAIRGLLDVADITINITLSKKKQ